MADSIAAITIGAILCGLMTVALNVHCRELRSLLRQREQEVSYSLFYIVRFTRISSKEPHTFNFLLNS